MTRIGADDADQDQCNATLDPRNPLASALSAVILKSQPIVR